MPWSEELEELAERRRLAALLGGEDRVKRHRARGKLTVRERIDGRNVVVAGNDFTIRGGSAEASIWEKVIHAEQRARSHRVPIVRLVDGSGGGGSVASYLDLGRTYVPPLSDRLQGLRQHGLPCHTFR